MVIACGKTIVFDYFGRRIVKIDEFFFMANPDTGSLRIGCQQVNRIGCKSVIIIFVMFEEKKVMGCIITHQTFSGTDPDTSGTVFVKDGDIIRAMGE